jgi:arylsulfatase A
VGYKTMCIGKWHLGRPLPYMPTSRGFDHYYGIPYSNDMWPSVLVQDTTVIEQPVNLNTLTQRYTQQAVNFISQSKASPFLLYLAHTFPHIPLAASTAFQGKSGMGLYGDVIEELDWSVGQVLQSLKDNGLDENTLVMFTSDNGPWYLGSPGKLRGRKGWTYEGGVREPFIARWPGKIPAGRTNERVVHSIASTMDLMPTIAGLANAPLPANALDGLDIWPVLSGQQQDVANRDVFLYFDSWNLQCARMGEWKLHVSRYNNPPFGPDPLVGSWNLPIVPELYNLEKDPDESYNVAAEHPDIVAQIQARIQALLPTFPPDVMNAWTSTMNMQTQATPDGALPIPATPQ